MEKLNMCRICLVENVNMHSLVNTKLQDLYEKLTAMPFQSEDSKPLQVCYVCYARLRACHRLQISCLKSEKLLAQMLENHQVKPTLARADNLITIKHPLVHLSYVPLTAEVPGVKNIKQEGGIEDAQDSITDDGVHIQYTGARHRIKTEDMCDEDYYASNDSTHTVQAKVNLVTKNTEPAVIYDVKTEHSVQDVETDLNNVDIIIENNLKPSYDIPSTELINNVLTEPGAVAEQNEDLRSSAAKDPKKENSNNRTYKCNKCERTFSLKHNLRRHIRTHTDLKPYKCDVCGTNFREKAYLIRHTHIHTGEKPYKCDVCRKCFSEKTYLMRHIRTHTGEKPHKCDRCAKRFSDKSALTKHMRAHTGEKPYKCGMCDKCYRQKRSLMQHICLTHSGVKLFKCDVCGKSFVLKSYLKLHMRVHTDGQPHKCDICKKCFNSRQALRRHILMHSGQKLVQSVKNNLS